MIDNLQTKLILLSILFILPLFPAFAENIRGQIVDVLSVDSEAVNFGIYDLVTISDRKSSEFQTGIELRIDIPPGLRAYRNSFALLLYKNIKPFPDTGMVNYSAKRYFMRLLPSRESTYIASRTLLTIMQISNRSLMLSRYTLKMMIYPDSCCLTGSKGYPGQCTQTQTPNICKKNIRRSGGCKIQLSQYFTLW